MEDVELNEGGERAFKMVGGKKKGKNKDLPPMAVGMGPDKKLRERFRKG